MFFFEKDQLIFFTKNKFMNYFFENYLKTFTFELNFEKHFYEKIMVFCHFAGPFYLFM